MKKVLFVATVVKKHINSFHLPFIKMFKEKGWETSVCARNDFEDKKDCIIPCCDKYYDMPFERFPFKPNNIRTLFSLRKLMKKENFDIIHCHTPAGGVLARLAAFGLRKKGTRVMYTAHGFHFYKGAPLLNWLIYYPIEWFCSFFADDLITINQEDYKLAKKHMHSKNIHYVPGVGVDTNKFHKTCLEKNSIYKELGIPEDAFVLLSVGELSIRKNHEAIIKAVHIMKNPKIHYCIAGIGDRYEYLKRMVSDLKLNDSIHFLGYRKDINELCNISDVFCFPSLQEGLPVALMEAMSVGMPCVISRIRGNSDVVEDGKGGYLCRPTDYVDFADKISILYNDEEKRKQFGSYNKKTVISFDITGVAKDMEKIYFEEAE